MELLALIDPLLRVVQIEKSSGVFEVAYPFIWVECGGGVTVGDHYINNEFVKEEGSND